jgi:hypothetical protein
MSLQRVLLLSACATVSVCVAVVLLGARGAPAQRSFMSASPATIAKRLVGRWSGPKFGAEAQRFRADRWELAFTRSSGAAAIGRKRHRETGRWSAYEQVDAVVDSTGRIWAVDEDGTINGRLRGDGTLELVYLEPGTTDSAASRVRLRRLP